jgi:hypothetical protein
VAAVPQRAATTPEPRQTAVAAGARQAPTAAEARQAPGATEAQQVATAVGAQQAPATVEARQAPTATEAQQAATAAVAQPALALAGSSQATAVEIPDDDVPPPGWDQWTSLPTSAPESQAGALVRRWDDRMVAGGSRYSTEASWSRAGLPASGGPAASPERGQERVDASPPHFADAQAE